MVVQYKNSKNKSWNNDISSIKTPPGVSKNPKDQSEDHFGELERLDSVQTNWIWFEKPSQNTVPQKKWWFLSTVLSSMTIWNKSSSINKNKDDVFNLLRTFSVSEAYTNKKQCNINKQIIVFLCKSYIFHKKYFQIPR